MDLTKSSEVSHEFVGSGTVHVADLVWFLAWDASLICNSVIMVEVTITTQHHLVNIRTMSIIYNFKSWIRFCRNFFCVSWKKYAKLTKIRTCKNLVCVHVHVAQKFWPSPGLLRALQEHPTESFLKMYSFSLLVFTVLTDLLLGRIC